jgi:hypothetical protein
MKQQEQLSALTQVNQGLIAEIQGLRQTLFNLSQENTNLRMRLDSTPPPAPQVTTAKKASGKAGNAKLQVTTASPVPQQQEVPPPVPVTVLVQQESKPVHNPPQPKQEEAEPVKVELEPETVPVSVMAQQGTPVQPEVQELTVQPEVQEPPAPVSTAEEIDFPEQSTTPEEQSTKTRTEEELTARREEKKARERAYRAQKQAEREMQAAEEARVAAEEKVEIARVAAEKKAKKVALKLAEAQEKERKIQERTENERRAREKAEKRTQAQLAREQEERIVELKNQEELFKQEMARLEKEAQAKKNAEKRKASLAEAEKEGKRLEKISQPPDCAQELTFALLVSNMKENKVKDPFPEMQTFLEGMPPAKTLEYICRALFELDTPRHVLRYDKFKGVSCKISVGSILDLRAAEQYKNLVTVRQALDESDLWQLTIQFNAASPPFYSPKVPLETISHWLDSKKLFKVIEEFSAIRTEEVGKCKSPGWTQSTIETAIKGILAHDPNLLESLKTDFDPAGDETDYWGMKKVQITYKKRSSDGTAKTVTKRMTRIQLIDWYLLGNLSAMVSTSCYLPC